MERGLPTEPDPDFGSLRRYRPHDHPSFSKVWHSLLGLYWAAPYWYGEPVVPFRPEGLVIWDAPPQATLSQALVGMNEQVKVSYAPVPARWFASGDNYQQIAQAIAAGKDPPAWCTWNAIGLGLRLRLHLLDARGEPLGPESGIELCVWGLSAH